MISTPRSRDLGIAAATLLLVGGRADAQIPFGIPKVVDDMVPGAVGVYGADLDGDGDDDVLSASLLADTIAWNENLGAGQFGGQQVISSQAIGARDVFADDLDGDGDLDVLSASSVGDTIDWYENDGTGQFGPPQTITDQADGARSVYSIDLDGDGDSDVLSASYFDDEIAWYENLGSGSFGTPQILSDTADGAESVYAVDLDLDGDADVLSASALGDEIAWYENLGGGVFGAGNVLDAEADGALSVFASDLDGDGDPDVLATAPGGPRVFLIENLGGGSFGAKSTISSITTVPRHALAADLDGDGDADVLVASFTGAVAGHVNLGSNQFQALVPGVGPAAGAFRVFATDLDSDGDTDVLAAASEDDRIVWFESHVAGIFGDENVILGDTSPALDVLAADLDGDGDQDVVSALNHSAFGHFGTVTLNRNLGGGAFGSPSPIDSVLSPNCVAADDLDGDGDRDLLVGASEQVPYLVEYENSGFATFHFPQAIPQPGEVWRVEIADLDGDGDGDPLTACFGNAGGLHWVENLGGGSFGPHQLVGGHSPATQSLAVGDLNGDGLLDVLTAEHSTGTISWFPGAASGGSFGPQNLVASGLGEPRDAIASDLDGDGDTDIAFAADEIGWIPNAGSGAFASIVTLSDDASSGRSVFAIDLDGDADVDLLSGSSGFDYNTSWYENSGAGAFSGQKIIVERTSRRIRASDLDDDGAPDVLAADAFGHKVVWYENQVVSAPLENDVLEVSLSNGGVQTLELTAGAHHGSKAYFLLGSASGTSPGFVADGHLLPLQVVDPYFEHTLLQPNTPPLDASFGLLDAGGRAAASFSIAAGALPPSALGLTLHHAYVVFGIPPNGAVVFASNAAPVTLVP